MVGSTEILTAIRELSNSKQLGRGELHGLLEDGIKAALAKKLGPNVQAEVAIDDDRGAIDIRVLKTVVEHVEDGSREVSLDEARFEDPEFQVGDTMEIPVDFAEFGRTAVQAAKQRIIQRVREGERTKIRDEFSGRVGELLSGEIQQIERGKLVVMLNKFREAEAIIPYRDQNHREHFHQGEPIRAVLKRVEETPKGPRLILSRGDPLFVQALFRLEVPEIQQGIVEIRAAAREVGSRTKIAVVSRDDSIDPVGACVGLKGSRVQAVVNELGGERIDIVPWSSDPERFAKLALAPARVARVFSDAITKTIQAVVDEDQLSLAIGRNGQNVRLASELTGWKIDLYSSREWLERAGEAPLFAPLPEEAPDEAADVKLSEIQGDAGPALETATVAVLEEAGYRTLNDVIDLERDDLLRLPGIAPGEADRIMAIINDLTEEGPAEDSDTAPAGASASDAGAETASAGSGDAGPSGSDHGATGGAGGGGRRGVTEPGDGASMDQALERKLLRLVGLGVRSRGAVVGVQRVRDAALRNRLAFAVVAPDASRHSLDKVVPLLNARRVRWVLGPSAQALGSAVGRETTAAVGIVDRQLASGIRKLVDASSVESS